MLLPLEALAGRLISKSYVSELMWGGNLMYEPEQFPGAMFRMDNPKVVFLIFSTGKIVCVGAKKEIYEGVENLRRRLEGLGVLYKEVL